MNAAPSNLSPSAPPTQEKRVSADASDTPAVGFDVVLDLTQTMLLRNAQRAGQLSPDQMFEPNAGNGSKTSAGQQQSPSDADALQQAQKDASRVDAQRQQAHDRSSNTTPRTGQDGTNRQGATDTLDGRLSTRNSEQKVRPDVPLGRDTQPSTAMREGDAKQAAQPATRLPANGPDATAQVSDAAPRGVGKADAVPSGAGSGKDVAQQIGRILTATRAGGVESAKAPTGAQAAPDAQGGKQPSTARAAKNAATQDPSAARSDKADKPASTRSPMFDKLIKSFRLQSSHHNASARLQLDPPELGRMRVDVRLTGGTLDVEVRTETEEARTMFSRRAGALRDALSEHGVQVQRFVVTVDRTDGDAPMSDHDAAWSTEQHQQREQHAAGASTGRGRQDATEPMTATVAATSDTEIDETTSAESRLDVRI